MRIAIMGGSFNPVHIGHILFAKSAINYLPVKKVTFIPVNIPPHKSQEDLADPIHRLNMLKIAIDKDNELDLSDIEIKRGGVSYTVDTVKALSKKYEKIYYLIGSDTLTELASWKNIDYICKVVEFVVAKRPNVEIVIPKIKNLVIRFIEMSPIDISSSMIRQMIKERRRIDNLVPEGVEEYIIKHRLYR